MRNVAYSATTPPILPLVPSARSVTPRGNVKPVPRRNTPAPRPGSDQGSGHLALGIVVGLGITLFVLITIMLIYTYTRTNQVGVRADATPEAPIVIENGVIVRPTPMWRFRDEWLTPHPKN